MRRRLLLLLAALAALTLLLLATIPWWLGVAVDKGARSRGLTFGAYERIGYARFALRDVEYRREGVRVSISRVEADTPLLFGWRHLRSSASPVIVERWSVEVQRRNPPAVPKVQPGWMPLRNRLRQIAAQLDRWLPRARTGAGLVRWANGELTVASAAWAERQLAVEDLTFRALKVAATAAFPADEDVIRLALRTPDAADGATLESRGAEISGEIGWWEQRAALSATFGPRGWLPPRASLQAENLNIPGARLKLGDLYSMVRGRVRVDWSDVHFVTDLSATADPVEGKKAPPLTAVLRGQGDAQTFTLQTLDATLPGITARLTEPVTVERSGRLRESAARFALEANLAQQPWFAASGLIAGEARVVAGVSASSPVEFRLVARDVAAQGLTLARVETEGRLEWPRLRIATGHLVGGEGERMEFRGGWDFRAEELQEVVLDGTIRRQSLARWLPAQPEFDALTIRAEAAGKLPDVSHSGRAQLGSVKFKAVNAVALDLNWRGRGTAMEAFHVRATAGATTLAGGGSADRASVTLRELELSRDRSPLLRLQSPTVVRWRPTLQVEPFHLAGPHGSLNAALTWGEAGQIEIAARNLASNWFADLLAAPPVAWRLELLAITGTWDRGPMVFSVAAGAALELAEGRSATVNVAARGGKDGLAIDALRATESNATVVNATGRLPLLLRPGTPRLIEMDPDGALRVDATAAPHAAFWEQLAKTTGVELISPEAGLRIAGTWQRPEGDVRLKAVRLTVDPARVKREIPTIEGLDVQLTGDRGGVNLQTFAINIEGQPVRARGRLPVPEGKWQEALKQPLAFLQRDADVRLEVPDADVAVFARFLPAALAPKGRLQIDLGYKAGAFDGYLRLRDAASRPLGPLGVLQEINADLVLSGRKLALQGVTAKAGGQPVTLTGAVELPAAAPGSTAGMIPRFDVALRGENLPFVRQTGLLIRGDLDLKLQTPPGASVTGISGEVRLRDSLFLQDVRAFLPKGGGASPTRRPPYFAVETPPVNTWTLAVEVIGEEFLRLRTPVFAGVASARFRLGGTLGEPRALGEVVIEEGRVRMPFANFDVMQGSIRLTEANPYEPEIYLRATARRWDYDLTMEIDGQASKPNMVFNSSPALDSEQVLLMVMTGAAPSNAVNSSATQRIANLGYFLGSSLFSNLGSNAADPDRWTVATGEKVTAEGEETLDVEYKLSERWTLTAERNEYDEFVAGAKWRIFRDKTGKDSRAEHAKK